ncbi:MAG TPA: hypothetical protein VFR49_02805 [Solirubrobacteraceae bacterium]|nr:hypothetical protein [Solirubrobacteraceae bacterium]
MEIRSYRAVFELERRVYRIDTLRLNPGGVPLRGIVYAAAMILATGLAGRIGPVGLLLGVLPWYVGYVGLPIAAAALGTIVRIEGRPFHLAAWALAAHRLAPRHTTRLGRAPAPRARWRPDRVVFIPDGSDSRLRRLRYRGPGAVLVCCAHDRVDWRRPGLGRGARGALVTVHAREGGRPLLRPAGLELGPGAVLEIRTVPAP